MMNALHYLSLLYLENFFFFLVSDFLKCFSPPFKGRGQNLEIRWLTHCHIVTHQLPWKREPFLLSIQAIFFLFFCFCPESCFHCLIHLDALDTHNTHTLLHHCSIILGFFFLRHLISICTRSIQVSLLCKPTPMLRVSRVRNTVMIWLFGFGVCVKGAPGHFQRKSKILRTASQMKWRIVLFSFFLFGDGKEQPW